MGLRTTAMATDTVRPHPPSHRHHLTATDKMLSPPLSIPMHGVKSHTNSNVPHRAAAWLENVQGCSNAGAERRGGGTHSSSSSMCCAISGAGRSAHDTGARFYTSSWRKNRSNAPTDSKQRRQ
ncbi:hypothetical protein BJV78DRAFT_1257157 [Lactifluus subvellereus]|nr:hypothetical protein BJV78DRAFT_1257157 [Lactifluus subvellereus]